MSQGEDLIPIESLEEIPLFGDETEEAEFWSTHSFGEQLLEQMQPIDEAELPRLRPRHRRFWRRIPVLRNAVQPSFQEPVLDTNYARHRRTLRGDAA